MIASSAGRHRPTNVPFFKCPNCDALYQIVQVEAGQKSADREITCSACGGPIPGRDGKFVMKYFLLRKAAASESAKGGSHLYLSVAVRAVRLGQQLSCDRGSAKREDEELEDIGVSAVWFELVDDQEQHGGDEADRERIEESPHLRPTLIAATSIALDGPLAQRARRKARTRGGTGRPWPILRAAQSSATSRYSPLSAALRLSSADRLRRGGLVQVQNRHTRVRGGCCPAR